MAGEDARLKAGLKSAEDELNLIKNQIQQTLLDIREHILDVTNPFNSVSADMLDDDEEVIEDGGGGGDVAEVGDGDGGESSDSETVEGDELPEELPLEDEESLEDLMGDDMGDEIEEIPDDGMMGGDGEGGGSSGGLSDLLEPEEDLDEEDEDEDFQLDEEEPDEEEPQPEAMEEDKVEEPMPEEEELPQDRPSGDAVGEAVAAAIVANVDLLTMASLVRWTAITRDRIGPNRLDILLDAYEMAGRISPAMKNVIKTLSALGDEDGDGIPVRDVVTAMVRMEGVLNTGQTRESNRLLGLLLEMDDDPLDRLVA